MCVKISIVKNHWPQHMVLHQGPCMVFPKLNQIVEQIIPSLVEKTMEKHVFLTLGCRAIVTTSFYLWMSRFQHDTFALVINFFNSQWVSYYIMMGLFKAHMVQDL